MYFYSEICLINDITANTAAHTEAACRSCKVQGHALNCFPLLLHDPWSSRKHR